MLPGFGQLFSLLRNAGTLKERMQALQERLAAARFSGEAGAGQVRATVDCRSELVELRIDPALVASGDVELLEELVCAAIRDAAARSRDGVRKEIESITGGVDLGGMLDAFGPPVK